MAAAAVYARMASSSRPACSCSFPAASDDSAALSPPARGAAACADAACEKTGPDPVAATYVMTRVCSYDLIRCASQRPRQGALQPLPHGAWAGSPWHRPPPAPLPGGQKARVLAPGPTVPCRGACPRPAGGGRRRPPPRSRYLLSATASTEKWLIGPITFCCSVASA